MTAHNQYKMEVKVSNTQGRCVAIRQNGTENAGEIDIQSETAHVTVQITETSAVKIGDIVRLSDAQGTDSRLKILTPSHSGQMDFMKRILDPRRLHATGIRAQVETGIREFFLSRNFHETRTPLLVPCPGMEPHIRPFRVNGGAALPTSPEFAMKRLLVGGLEKIFQLCPSFRDEPNSTTHQPEFMMLEWYRAYAGYLEIMSDTEELFEFIARKLSGVPVIHFQGKPISVQAPWPRLRVRDLFETHADINLLELTSPEHFKKECARLGLQTSQEDTWDDLYFRVWLNHIEPNLPENQAVFVMRYPPSQAALSVIDQDPDGSHWARRFEAYAGGLELGNAFEELTDPVEQRKRFEKDMSLREQVYGETFPKTPLDEDFLRALEEGMPPSGGIAVGVDRMVMLFANEPDIEKTIWLTSYSPSTVGASTDN